MQAPAEVVAFHTGGDIHIVGGLDTSDEESEAETPPPTKKRLPVNKNTRNWKKEDIATGFSTQQPWTKSYRSFYESIRPPAHCLNCSLTMRFWI